MVKIRDKKFPPPSSLRIKKSIQNRTTISLQLQWNKCISFDGSIPYIGYFSIFTHSAGLLLVGGRDDTKEYIANESIWSIQFDDGKFKQEVLTKMPYSVSHPSVHIIEERNNEKLFVCGGWWNKGNLKKCFLYNLENGQWTNLQRMKHSHQSGGICEWKERGNKMIVAGGYRENKYVQEYDMHKNEWTDLPNLNKVHATYPALFTSNNILFCVGGARRSSEYLGEIELFDPRDRANKWIHVDTVEHYFKLSKDSGAGLNCFLWA